MRLQEIYIESYKNIQNMRINFNTDVITHIFIGQNGSGKTNLFEAILLIFKNLDLHRKPILTFEIKYIIKDKQITIKGNKDTNRSHTIILVNGSKITLKEFRNNKEKYMPKNIFAYYSGPSNRLESIFDDHQKRYYDQLKEGVLNPRRPFFYAMNVHSQFVLLSFFSFEDEESRKFLSDYFGIKALDSILFVLQKPPWKSKTGDDRFWNSRGTVQHFLNDLYEKSLAPIYDKETHVSEFKTKQERVDHLYLYIKNQGVLNDLAKKYQNNRLFFKMLESTYMSKLIYEVKINIVMNNDYVITFNDLSEGEQQLLIVFGLLKFTQDEESIFLLDEPDTHLNPAWKLDYLNIMEKIVKHDESSQILIATHEPLTVGGLLKDQVILFEVGVDGNVIVDRPIYDPRGMGVAGILTSDIFGLRTTVDTDTQDKLDRKRELYLKKDRNKKEQEEMDRLTIELGELDYPRTIRDPYYDDFLRALQSSPDYKKRVLTSEEKKIHENNIRIIIKEIIKEE